MRSRDIAATITGSELTRTLAAARGDDHFAQVVDSNGTVVASSANIQGDAPDQHARPRSRRLRGARRVTGLPAGDSAFRIVARRVDTTTGIYTVYVAGSLDSVTKSADSLADLLLVGLPFLLLLVGATTWVVTGRALPPGRGDPHRSGVDRRAGSPPPGARASRRATRSAGSPAP